MEREEGELLGRERLRLIPFMAIASRAARPHVGPRDGCCSYVWKFMSCRRRTSAWLSFGHFIEANFENGHHLESNLRHRHRRALRGNLDPRPAAVARVPPAWVVCTIGKVHSLKK